MEPYYFFLLSGCFYIEILKTFVETYSYFHSKIVFAKSQSNIEFTQYQGTNFSLIVR